VVEKQTSTYTQGRNEGGHNSPGAESLWGQGRIKGGQRGICPGTPLQGAPVMKFICFK